MDLEARFLEALENKNSIDVMMIITLHGVDPAPIRFEPEISLMHKAAALDMLPLVEFLIDQHGWPVDHVTPEARGRITPLGVAVKHGSWEVVRYLHEAGGTCNWDDLDIHQAVLSYGDVPNATRYLLYKNPSQVTATNQNGFTPLHLAAGRGDEVLVRVLIEAGAPLDAFSNKKITPLHMAVKNNHLAAVEMLMEAGANPSSRNNDGQTPRELANSMGLIELSERLPAT